MPFSAIAGARASGAALDPTISEEGNELLTVAKAHGAAPEQIRLAWTLAQGAHVLAIPGTGDPAHLEANVAAGAIRLTRDDLTVLEPAA